MFKAIKTQQDILDCINIHNDYDIIQFNGNHKLLNFIQLTDNIYELNEQFINIINDNKLNWIKTKEEKNIRIYHFPFSLKGIKDLLFIIEINKLEEFTNNKNITITYYRIFLGFKSNT